jgi:hypothetical protein
MSDVTRILSASASQFAGEFARFANLANWTNDDRECLLLREDDRGTSLPVFSRAATTPRVANSLFAEEVFGRRVGWFMSAATSRPTHCMIAVTLGRPHCTALQCNDATVQRGRVRRRNAGCVPTNTRTFRLRGGRLDCHNRSRHKGVAVCQLRHALTSASARGSLRVAWRSPARNESRQYRGGLRMNDNDLSSAGCSDAASGAGCHRLSQTCITYTPPVIPCMNSRATIGDKRAGSAACVCSALD